MAKRGRPAVRVIISPSERTTLEQWARRRTTAQGVAQRARIILLCAAGHSTPVVAAELRITRQTVGRWRGRFLAKRLDGLSDEPQIKRGAHRSVRALETTIRGYLAITNEAPKPFVWTKTADEILTKVAKFVSEHPIRDTSLG